MDALVRLATKPMRSRDGRLGLLFAGIAIWQALLVWLIAAPLAASMEVWRVLTVCIGILLVGVGLMLELRIARYAAAAPLAVLAGVKVWGQIGVFRQFAVYQREPWFEYTPTIVVDVATTLAFTLLVVWLCVAMIASLVADERVAPRFTVRFAAAAWLSIAARHLLPSFQLLDELKELGLLQMLGLSTIPSGQITVSTDDVVLVGFMGWPLWHLAVAIICTGILIGPARLWPRLSTALLALFGMLVPLAAMWGSQMMIGQDVMVAAVGATGMLAYLVWWLRIAINDLCIARDRPVATHWRKSETGLACTRMK